MYTQQSSSHVLLISSLWASRTLSMGHEISLTSSPFAYGIFFSCTSFMSLFIRHPWTMVSSMHSHSWEPCFSFLFFFLFLYQWKPYVVSFFFKLALISTSLYLVFFKDHCVSFIRHVLCDIHLCGFQVHTPRPYSNYVRTSR